MSREELLDRIRAAMVELFELEPSRVREETKVFEELDLDSIDAIDLVARLQTFTGKRVDPEALRSVRTVGDVVDLVQSQLAARADGESGPASPS